MEEQCLILPCPVNHLPERPQLGIYPGEDSLASVLDLTMGESKVYNLWEMGNWPFKKWNRLKFKSSRMGPF